MRRRFCSVITCNCTSVRHARKGPRIRLPARAAACPPESVRTDFDQVNWFRRWPRSIEIRYDRTQKRKFFGTERFMAAFRVAFATREAAHETCRPPGKFVLYFPRIAAAVARLSRPFLQHSSLQFIQQGNRCHWIVEQRNDLATYGPMETIRPNTRWTSLLSLLGRLI